jgi:hypothetical protein
MFKQLQELSRAFQVYSSHDMAHPQEGANLLCRPWIIQGMQRELLTPGFNMKTR